MLKNTYLTIHTNLNLSKTITLLAVFMTLMWLKTCDFFLNSF